MAGNPEGKRRQDRYSRISEDDIKMDQYDSNWILLAGSCEHSNEASCFIKCG